jgi:excisionase family DNA binding protein
MSIEKELLSRREAAEFLGLAEQTLAGWASNGKYNLPFVKVGPTVRYRLSDLRRWCEQHLVGAGGGGGPATAA